MRIALGFTLGVLFAFSNCHSSSSVRSVDALVLEAVVEDPHFSEWTLCGDARYALHPISAPPAYEDQKPFFFTSYELGTNPPQRLAPELLDSLREENSTERPLPRLRNGIAMTSEPLSQRRVWLSFPGYDSTRSVAAVAVTRNSVGDCPAAGYIVVLRRARREWSVHDRPTEWVE